MQKIGLCVGINAYPGGNELTWPVKDAKDWTALLTERGFKVTTLFDSQATRANILSNLKGLLALCQAGDSFFFQFSGHGTQVPDTNSDEIDHLDEAICCYDLFSRPGVIFDDEFWKIFTSKPAGVKCMVAMDSCHSQTVMKAGLMMDTEPNLVKRAIRWQNLPVDSYTREGPKEGPQAKMPWPVGEFCGCESSGFSYDASDLKNGAFTYWAIKTARELPKGATNTDWIAAIRKHLPSPQYPQTPHLTGSYLKHEILS